MKITKPNNKDKHRIATAIVSILGSLVMIVWAVQAYGMFVSVGKDVVSKPLWEGKAELAEMVDELKSQMPQNENALNDLVTILHEGQEHQRLQNEAVNALAEKLSDENSEGENAAIKLLTEDLEDEVAISEDIEQDELIKVMDVMSDKINDVDIQNESE